MRLLGYGFRMNTSNTSQRLPYSGLPLWGESPGDLKQQYSTFHLTGKSGSKITAVPSKYLLEWRDVPLNVFCKYYSREKCNNYITFNATILQNIFRISCTSSKNIFGVMLKKEMPITIPFLYSIQTNVQTLYTSMNTSYQFFDLIATIVSNN